MPVEQSERRLVTPAELAEFLGVPAHTLAQWRSRGLGPAFVRVGRYVRYRWSAVERWIDEREKTRTGAVAWSRPERGRAASTRGA
jgi:predicted DNA-binding transcriptional regulator AlpA